MKELKLGIFRFAMLFCVSLSSVPAFAYNPLNTDDPGTVDFRHFELEWANYAHWLENSLDLINGDLAFRCGPAPRLEFETQLDFIYALNMGGDDYISGWSNTEFGLKYRILGDGDQPFNLAIEGGVVLPTADKRFRQGFDDVTSFLFALGSFGSKKLRFLWNAGEHFWPNASNTMIYGGALEFHVHDDWWLLSEISGETDFVPHDGDDPATLGFGFVHGEDDPVALSLGGEWGISPDAERFYLVTGITFGW